MHAGNVKQKSAIIPFAPIEPLIRVIRGQRVILDSDLARIYDVPTRQINQAIKRNQDRFPKDFAFQIDRQEFASLRSQIVIQKDVVVVANFQSLSLNTAQLWPPMF